MFNYVHLPCPAGTPFITRCSVLSSVFRGAPATYFKVNNYKIFNKSGKEIGACQLDLNVSGIPSDSRAVTLTFMN